MNPLNALNITQHPKVGDQVLSFDGQSLGSLRRRNGNHLRIHRRLGRDFCIPAEFVYRDEGNAIRLYLKGSALGRYRLNCDCDRP